MQLLQHPLSASFPAMMDDEFSSLRDSIEAIGVQNPIAIYDGMVIDGWHRYRAANDLGMDCPSVELVDVDPRDFVIAQNKARRNLTASQRAAAVTAVYSWHPASVSCSHFGGEPGSPPLSESAIILGVNPVHPPPMKTNAELAELAGTTERTIQQAKTAHRAGLGESVINGEMTAKEAARVATGKPKEQVAQKQQFTEPPPINEDLDAIAILSEENDRLNDRLAVAAMDATPEERAAASETIDTLRATVRTLTAELDAVKASRDSYMTECSEMKKQCMSYKRQLDKLKKAD